MGRTTREDGGPSGGGHDGAGVRVTAEHCGAVGGEGVMLVEVADIPSPWLAAQAGNPMVRRASHWRLFPSWPLAHGASQRTTASPPLYTPSPSFS